MNEIAIGKRVRIIPIHPLFKRWTGRCGEITQREWEDNELQYRVLLDETRILHSGAESSVMPGEGYLFRRVELESL